jgi:nucleotide-binding universal stress UspA family protein
MQLKNILVPTDFSETAEHATGQAIELAAMHGARLELFHVVEPYGTPPPNMMEVVREYMEKLEREAESSLASRVELMREDDIDAHYSKVHHVAPIEAIADKVESLEPDLVVMGTHGHRGFQRLVLGSVAEKVLRTVPVSVLTMNVKASLVKRGTGFKQLVVPVDFSEFSKRALEAAFALVAEGGAVHVVHVVDTPIYPTFYPGPVVPPVGADPDLANNVREHLGRWLEGREAELSIRGGDPALEILDACGEAKPDLLVMGTRGLRGVSHVLLGSVTEKVVRRAEVPVLTVH